MLGSEICQVASNLRSVDVEYDQFGDGLSILNADEEQRYSFATANGGTERVKKGNTIKNIIDLRIIIQQRQHSNYLTCTENEGALGSNIFA